MKKKRDKIGDYGVTSGFLKRIFGYELNQLGSLKPVTFLNFALKIQSKLFKFLG